MQSDQDWLERAKTVVRADAASIEAILDSVDDNLIAVARRLAACRGKILVTGSGTSGNVAARGAHILSVCGAAAFHLSPGDGLHGGLGVLQADDVVLALSKGGSSAELNDFCARAKTLCSGVIAITADPASPLAALSDHVITLKLPADGNLGGVVATGSSLAAAAVTDVLAEMLRVARDYSWESLLFTHPSGAVGRDAEKSLKRLGSN